MAPPAPMGPAGAAGDRRAWIRPSCRDQDDLGRRSSLPAGGNLLRGFHRGKSGGHDGPSLHWWCEDAAMAERVVAIVLAAGAGSRFGGGKLLAKLSGKPLLQHVLDRVAEAGMEE